jgi:hypothetical protein
VELLVEQLTMLDQVIFQDPVHLDKVEILEEDQLDLLLEILDYQDQKLDLQEFQVQVGRTVQPTDKVFLDQELIKDNDLFKINL